jgi:hypothetical protein
VKGIRTEEELICEIRHPSYQVNQICEMGKKNYFKVYVIHYASDLSIWSPQKKQNRHGVIASS